MQFNVDAFRHATLRQLRLTKSKSDRRPSSSYSVNTTLQMMYLSRTPFPQCIKRTSAIAVSQFAASSCLSQFIAGQKQRNVISTSIMFGAPSVELHPRLRPRRRFPTILDALARVACYTKFSGIFNGYAILRTNSPSARSREIREANFRLLLVILYSYLVGWHHFTQTLLPRFFPYRRQFRKRAELDRPKHGQIWTK